MQAQDRTHPPRTACIGLIGGLGVGAAIHYYRELARVHEERGAVLRLVMAHADIRRGLAYSAAGQLVEMAEYLRGFIEQLRAAGADFAVIPAATPHSCHRQLEPITPLPLVSLLDSTREGARARGFRRVALFGTRATVESRLFDALDGIEVVTPRPDEVDVIHTTYVRLATDGKASAGDREGFIELARRLESRERVDAVLLAGTDLTLLFNASNTPFPYLDCAEAHLDAIVRRAFATETTV